MKIKNGLTPQKLQRKTARVFELAGAKIRAIDAAWDPARGTDRKSTRLNSSHT